MQMLKDHQVSEMQRRLDTSGSDESVLYENLKTWKVRTLRQVF
jgi:hypothetical protein